MASISPISFEPVEIYFIFYPQAWNYKTNITKVRSHAADGVLCLGERLFLEVTLAKLSLVTTAENPFNLASLSDRRKVNVYKLCG